MNRFSRAYWGPVYPELRGKRDWFCADHWRVKCDVHEREATVNAHGLNPKVTCAVCGRSLAALAATPPSGTPKSPSAGDA